MRAEDAVRIDIGEVFEDGPWSRFQKLVLGMAALAFVFDGIANQSLGVAIPALIQDWDVVRAAFAPVVALGLIGVAIGTIVGGVLGDRFGRRAGLIGSILLFGVMTVAGAFVHDINELMVVRFLDGLGIGAAIPNGAALISEFTPIRRRGRAIAVGMVFIPVGAMAAGWLGAIILPALGWRALFICAGILPILVAVAFYFVLPESPRILLNRTERREELLSVLNRCGHLAGPKTQFVDRTQAADRTPLSALLGRGMRTETLALWVAFFCLLMASYSIFSWLPTLLAGVGLTLAAASSGIGAFHMGGTVGGLMSGLLIERLGSRRAWIVLALGSVLAATGLAAAISAQASYGVLVSVLVVLGIFVAGVHTVLYTLAASIYPPFIRATGVGSASAFGRLGAVLSSFTGVLSLDLVGPLGFFVVISVLLALCLAAGMLIRGHLPADRA